MREDGVPNRTCVKRFVTKPMADLEDGAILGRDLVQVMAEDSEFWLEF